MNDITLFSRDIMGACVLLEKHDADKCTCSYCRNARQEKRNIFLWFPEFKGRNSWRVIGWKKKGYYFYFRSTLPHWTRFFGFEFVKWSYGFRLYLLPPIWSHPNSLSAFLTYSNGSPYRTIMPHVESFLWMSTIKSRKCQSGVFCKEL